MDRACASKDGKHLYAKIMYDENYYAPTYVLNIDTSENTVRQQFFVNHSSIETIKASDSGDYIAIQTSKQFLLYQLSSKKKLFQEDVKYSTFQFKGNSLVFQKCEASLYKYDLLTQTTSTLLGKNRCITCIRSLCLASDDQTCFFISNVKRSSRTFIVKYNYQTKKYENIHHSKHGIISIAYIEREKLLLTAKTSDTVSLYSTQPTCKNLHNFRSSGTLKSVYISPNGDYFVAFYERGSQARLSSWNIETKERQAQYTVSLPESQFVLDILSVRQDQIVV